MVPERLRGSARFSGESTGDAGGEDTTRNVRRRRSAGAANTADGYRGRILSACRRQNPRVVAASALSGPHPRRRPVRVWSRRESGGRQLHSRTTDTRSCWNTGNRVLHQPRAARTLRSVLPRFRRRVDDQYRRCRSAVRRLRSRRPGRAIAADRVGDGGRSRQTSVIDRHPDRQ